MLDAVVNAAERTIGGDRFLKSADRLLGRESDAALHRKSGKGQVGHHLRFEVALFRTRFLDGLPHDVGGFAMVRHAPGSLAGGGRSPTVEAQEMAEPANASLT